MFDPVNKAKNKHHKNMKKFNTLNEARTASIDISLIIRDTVAYIKPNEDKTFSIVGRWSLGCLTYTINGTCTDHNSISAPNFN